MKPITGQYVYSEEKSNGKKFCGATCQNKHSNGETKQQVSNFWEKYKGWKLE